ncbi:MAG TPA: AI-2E family transporter [Draconibacterium sp.]|nr:AI-2E family transporter [Draconibacterium sp.]
MTEKNQTTNIYDTSIRLLFLALIVAWCLMLVLPFVSIILWGVILAMAFSPLHNTITKWLGGRAKLSSALIVLICLAIIFIPGWLFIDSVIEGVKSLKASFDADTLTIPLPSEKVRSWPLIGERIFAAWSAASANIQDFVLQHKEQIAEYGQKFLKGFLGIIGTAFQFVISIIIAGVLLVVKGANESVRKFFRKLAGDKGDEFADVAYKTVGNVVKGILGVAFIQAFLIGLGFLFAGVPAAGLWTLLVFMFAVLQLPPAIIVLPIIVWLFSAIETTPAIIWTIYLLIAGLSDNILKPILLGQGAPVPMLVIFLGVIGGFILSGFIGLFTGAIVISLGYKLFVAWLD